MAANATLAAGGQATAKLEAIYIVALTVAARNALASELAKTWIVEPAFDDPAALMIEPQHPLTIQQAWNAVHALRSRRDVRVVDPLWETELGWPKPEPELETTAVPDPKWPLVTVRAREAWELSRGKGSVIGHLDTGYTDHPELEPGAWLVDAGYDFVDDDADARDELVGGVGMFPGHGTATASMIASRETGTLAGSAPQVGLVPFRVSNSVIHVSMKRMVAGIRRATELGCHVISISAGGFWSAALHRAIRDAQAAGVIVVAAAGNYVRFVVWPAAYPEVIACAACSIDERPWKHSSRGDAVDITAPGAGVVVAKAGDTTYVSNGTSHATAITAGAVACWLAHHGRERLIARFGAHNLANVARDLLVLTARPLQGDPAGMGAGLLDMKGLLAAALPDPVHYLRFAPPVEETPDVDSLAAAEDLVGSIEPGALEALPLNARQPLADELAFHRALALGSPVTFESTATIPAQASTSLGAALATPEPLPAFGDARLQDKNP
jgi:subtilisin family serine protease